MARYSALALFLVAMVTIEARRPGSGPRPGPSNRHQQDKAIETLTQKVETLEHRLDRTESIRVSDTKPPLDPSTSDPVTAHGSCPNASPIHMHFHGEGEEHDDGDIKDAHVHIDIGLDSSDLRKSSGGPGKQCKCRGCQKKHLKPEEEYSAHCVMEPVDDDTPLTGKLKFKQLGKDQTVTISAEFEGLPEADAVYEMHIHVKTDLSERCSKTGPHFDPFDPDAFTTWSETTTLFFHEAAHFRDVGNLGRVTSSSDSKINHTFDGVRHSMFGPLSLVGRAADIHNANMDRLACCVIGWLHSPHDIVDMHGEGPGYSPSP